MSVECYRHLCMRYRGKPVEIRTRDGRVHHGIVGDVDQDRVFIRPFNNPGNPGGNYRNFGGYGYGGYGPGGYGGYGPGGYGYGGFGPGRFGYGIALGTILGLALFPLIF